MVGDETRGDFRDQIPKDLRPQVGSLGLLLRAVGSHGRGVSMSRSGTRYRMDWKGKTSEGAWRDDVGLSRGRGGRAGEGRLDLSTPYGDAWVGGILRMLMTCRKIGGGNENIRCVLDMVNYPGWWGPGFEAGEVGDGAGNVGQWRTALGPECQAET